MTYIPATDYRPELARLNSMVLSLTSAVVSLYGAITEIASATENQELRQALDQKANEVSKQLDEVIAAMRRGDMPPK